MGYISHHHVEVCRAKTMIYPQITSTGIKGTAFSPIKFPLPRFFFIWWSLPPLLGLIQKPSLLWNRFHWHWLNHSCFIPHSTVSSKLLWTLSTMCLQNAHQCVYETHISSFLQALSHFYISLTKLGKRSAWSSCSPQTRQQVWKIVTALEVVNIGM